MQNTYKNFINGEWIGGTQEKPNINPSKITETVGISFLADNSLVEKAVDGACESQRKWAETGIETRCDILMKIGNEIIARKDELGEVLAKEEGKTLKEGIGEVDRAGRFFQYYSAEAIRNMGEFTDSVRLGVEVEVIREPVGIVLIITPWNFPSALPAWKIAPALAFGNAVIFKPATLTPASACLLVDIIHRAGVPTGVVQMLLGSGSTIGMQLLQNEKIDAVSFTGSLDIGRVVAQESAKHLRPFQLEMGSKNSLLVLDDGNLETAISCAVNGAFFSTGQKCTATSRIIVTEKIYDSFKQKFIEETAKLKVGHALDPDSQIGPCVSEQQLEENRKYLKIAQDEGAKLVFQGKLETIESEGYYFSPVIFDETHSKMRINCEEVFGPITCLIKVKDYEEALLTCNDTNFGLTTSIITSSLKHATHFKRNAQSGCVMVNLPTTGADYHVPFGGAKLSSYGPREQGQYAREFYTKIKTAYLKA